MAPGSPKTVYLVACPHAEVSCLSSQRVIHKEPHGGMLAIAGAKLTEGENHQAVIKAGARAVEGLDWQPLCRGCSRKPHSGET